MSTPTTVVHRFRNLLLIVAASRDRLARRMREEAVSTTSRRPRAKDVFGAYGERVAVRHLIRDGMQILDRNWRCRDGEIDVVALDGAALVFCEVKSRRSARFGAPVEAVVAAKARRLRALAGKWIGDTGRHAREIRFDVIGVRPLPHGSIHVEHLRGVF